MIWMLRVGFYLACIGFVLSPDWGFFDPSIIGFWGIGVILGYDIARK